MNFPSSHTRIFILLFLVLLSNSLFSQVTINSENFNSGWGIWNDGGGDCSRATTGTPNGTASIIIQDNSGTASAMTSDNLNLSSYTSVDFTFEYQTTGFSSGEDFWLQYYNGSTWTTIATYTRGIDFNNGTTYNPTITLNSGTYTFATNSQFRLQCDASSNSDQAFIDNILIQGYLPSGPEINIQGNINSITDGDTTPSITDDTDFGNVDVSVGTAVHTFIIQNIGTTSLTVGAISISGANAADFSVTASPAGSVSGSGSTNFQITFNPSAVGLRTASVSIANNDSNENPYNFDIQGTGFIPTYSEVIVSVNWPSWSSENRVRVYDPSGTLLATIDNGYSGCCDNSYSTTLNLGCLLDASNYYIVMYDSYGDGWNGAGSNVTVTSGGSTVLTNSGSGTNSGGTTAYFNVSGGGSCASAPEIDIQGNSNSINTGDNTPSATDDTDFGSVNFTLGTVVHTFTIENTGSASLTIGAITFSGTNASDFTLTSSPAASVSASGTTTFSVTFNPSATGVRTATISIVNNDSDENPYTFDLVGTGTTTLQEIEITGLGNTIISGDVTPSITDDTDFGNVVTASGNSISTFIIENLGTVSNLLLTSSSPYVSISGAHAIDFTVTTIPSNSISASSNTSFAITFDPSADGLRTATVTIANNDANESSYTFSIQGTGYTPPPCGSTVLNTANFESGLDGWTDGGTNAARVNNATTAYLNNYSMEIRSIDATGNNSSILSPLLDLGGYDKVDFEFFFTAYNVENGESFLIEYSNNSGATWTTVSTYLCGDIVSKNADYESENAYTFYSKTSTLLDINYSFPAGTVSQFRVRSNASDATDLVYIDNITITGTTFCTPTTGPGGVTSNLDLWLRADLLDGSTVGSDGAAVSQWTDNGKGNHAKTRVSGQEPVYRNNTTQNINFNPVIEFENNNNTANRDMTYIISDGSRDELSSTSGFNSNDIFVVLMPDPTITTTMIPLDTFTSTDPLGNTQSEDVTGFGYGSYTQRFNSELLTYCIGTTTGLNNGYGRASTNTSINYNKIGIVNMRHNATNTGEEIYLNATQIGTSTSDAADFAAVNNTRYWLGRSQYWNGSFDGRIAEVITYSATNNDANDTAARNRIQSYLGIKYGITLAPDTNGTTKNYVNSDGNIIWNHTANIGYNHNIAGIGRDDASKLNQKQSKSINNASDGFGPIEGVLTIGLTNIYDKNSDNISSNPTTFNNKEFLVWGDNGANLNLAATTIAVDMSANIAGLTTPVSFTAMQRVWKIVETGGDISSCKVSIPQSCIRNITPPGSYLMFISSTGVFDPTADYRVLTPDGFGNLEANYDFNGTKYITFGYAPQVIAERSVYFDGVVDYIDVEDHLDLNTTEFTLSAWIKRDTGTVNASILSKRNYTDTEGYDLRINGTGRLEFSLNGGAGILASSVAIPENEWHQVAVIYNGSNATLYIDGVADTTASGLPAPVATSQKFLIAAADGYDPNTTDYFAGNIDEVRVWNRALTPVQLRYIMNQELTNDITLAPELGDVIPQTITKNEMLPVPWSDLAGYYPMSVYTYTNTDDMSGNGNQGALRNLDTVDFQTAPLPYKSQANGSWSSPATWLNNSVQTLPNSLSIIDGITPINWNIVEINHDITIEDFTTIGRERSLQGLIVNSGTLQVNGNTTLNTGNGLTITHYLKLDGTIDLEGESQLIQTTGSDFDPTSSGTLQRDQQGTADTFTYNYWSSPVGLSNSTTNNNAYTLPDIMTGVNFITSGYNGTASPVGIADYWIWKFSNKTSGDYSQWQHVRSTGTLLAGEGFTMKGPGTGSILTDQNYILQGKPNNGDINLSINLGNAYLVGNPYPSAIDANQFILDNGTTILGPGSTTGTLYFWEHWGGGSHILAEYQGGYATYSLAGGVPAAAMGTNDPNVGTGGTPTKTPGRYIPVAQGFFVSAETTGTIKFNNGQRKFIAEGSSSSLFVKSANTKGSTASVNQSEVDTRLKLRIGFNSVNKIHRQLLLTVDPKTTLGYDWGYDAPFNDNQKDDMYWMVNDSKYIIQGIDKIDNQSIIPLGLHTKSSGLNAITIDKIENEASNLKIYLHDKDLNIYHNLKESNYEVYLTSGEYLNRFEITFSDLSQVALSTTDFENNTLNIYYSNENTSIVLMNTNLKDIESAELFNILGQSVIKFNTIETKTYQELKTNKLNAGTYILKLNSPDGAISKKVLIK
jgi:trimeric autotransporter adhesin